MNPQSDGMEKLINSLKLANIIKNPRVESTMLKVDRANYCQHGTRGAANTVYLDGPCPIGYGATISAPHMHAYALEILEDRLVDGAKVLDVGSGSGYLTACMAHMVGPRGTVFGVDHVRQLVEQSTDNIKQDCEILISSERVKLIVADGRVGLPDYAPFDVIHVGAAAENLPDDLIDQLKEGGKMVLPIERENGKQMFESIIKHQGGKLETKQHLEVRYVPLTDIKSQVNSFVNNFH